MSQHPRIHISTRLRCALAAFGVFLCLTTLTSAQPDGGGSYSEFLKGSYLLEKGDVVEAVEHFERAWRLSDHDPVVGLKLAESYYLLKNFARCELVVDDILDGDPMRRDALMLKAKSRYIQRDTRSAVLFLLRVRENHGRSFEVERLLGNIHYELAEVKEALEAYGNCLVIDDSYPYIQFRYGRLLRVDEQTEAAEAAFRRAAELDPSFVEPTLALIDLLVDDGREDEALPILEGVVEKDPRNERAMITLCTIYLETGQHEAGIGMLERWRKHSPLSHESQVLLARLLFDSGDLDAAHDMFLTLSEGNPASQELLRILGEIRLKAGRTNEAREYFERAIAIDPADYRSYLALFFAGSSRFAGPDHVIDLTDEERHDVLLQAASYLPGDEFEGNYIVGVSFLSLDLLDEAERYLMRADEIRGRDFETLFNLATVYEKRGEFERAEPLLELMMELRVDDPTTLNFYGYLLSQMGKDLPRALEMLQKALAADPENGYYLDSLGWIYYQMGEYPRSVVELEKASAVVKDDPVILEHLGDAYAATRRFEEARAAYERSNELQGSNEILDKIKSTRNE